MISAVIGWGLVAVLLVSVFFSFRKALGGKAGTRALISDLLGTVALALVIGVLGVVPWSTSLPVWLWWLLCALVGALAGTVAHQLFRRRR